MAKNPGVETDLKVEVMTEVLGTETDLINLCLVLFVMNVVITARFLLNQETVNRYFVVIVLPKKTVEEEILDLLLHLKDPLPETWIFRS